MNNEAILTPYRVLDLSDSRGYFCGKILGDLGADVVKIERPGGDPGREVGPFYHDIPDPEKSLFWLAYNANKRAITLDIEVSEGQKIFKNVVKTADVVIESYPPGYLDNLALGYSTLAQINPGIIMASITAFGQDGPYSDYKDCDLVVQAMGGHMGLSGDPDRAPVRTGYLQSWLIAAADAAVAILIALYYRHSTGEGQYVDVSAQHSQIPGMLNAVGFWELQGNIMRREGCFRTGIGTIPQRQTWPCKDGFVTFVIMGGAFGARTNRALIEWMDEEAMADDFLKKIDWDTFDMGAATSEDLRHMMEYFGRFFTGHTKERLYNEGIKRRIMIYPVSSPRDLVACLQLKGRSFWVDVEHPYLDDVIAVPGSFGLGSESSPSIRCCAPLIGEHNEEVYLQELNFSREEVIMLKEGKII